MDKNRIYSLPILSTVVSHERTEWQFNLHKTNAANEKPVISLLNGRKSPGKGDDIPIASSLYSLSNEMDNTLVGYKGY